MIKNGKGTILFSGATAALRGSANFAGFAVAKFGLRALAQSMARELGPKGVHVAHIIIDGQINTPRQVQGNSNFSSSEKNYSLSI
jgi:short-subunit dehydrogenase